MWEIKILKQDWRYRSVWNTINAFRWKEYKCVASKFMPIETLPLKLSGLYIGYILYLFTSYSIYTSNEKKN